MKKQTIKEYIEDILKTNNKFNEKKFKELLIYNIKNIKNQDGSSAFYILNELFKDLLTIPKEQYKIALPILKINNFNINGKNFISLIEKKDIKSAIYLKNKDFYYFLKELKNQINVNSYLELINEYINKDNINKLKLNEIPNYYLINNLETKELISIAYLQNDKYLDKFVSFAQKTNKNNDLFYNSSDFLNFIKNKLKILNKLNNNDYQNYKLGDLDNFLFDFYIYFKYTNDTELNKINIYKKIYTFIDTNNEKICKNIKYSSVEYNNFIDIFYDFKNISSRNFSTKKEIKEKYMLTLKLSEYHIQDNNNEKLKKIKI